MSQSDNSYAIFHNEISRGLFEMEPHSIDYFVGNNLLGVDHLEMLPGVSAKTIALRLMGVSLSSLISKTLFTTEQLIELASCSSWPLNMSVLLATARHINCDKKVIKIIANKYYEENPYDDLSADDDAYELEKLILRHPSCPKRYLFPRCRSDMVFDAMIQNPTTHAPRLYKEVNKNSSWLHAVRGGGNIALAAATNPNCPSKLLQSIFEWMWRGTDCEPCDTDGEVRFAIMDHKKCTDTLRRRVFTELLESYEESILIRLCFFSETPDSLRNNYFSLLSKSRNPETLLAVADLPACTDKIREKVLGKLSKQKNIAIQTRLAACKYIDQELKKTLLDSLLRNENGIRQLAASQALDTEDLVSLSRCSDPLIRCVVAENVKCPDFYLSELANDPHPRVQLSVALNPRCPDPDWERISRPYLFDDVLEWPAIKHILESNSSKFRFPFCSADYYDKKGVRLALEQGAPNEIRAMALLSDAVSSKVLERFSKNRSWLCRAAVALNAKTDAMICARLRMDKHPIVQQLAQQGLTSVGV